jgi:hypothetical protein
MAHDSLLPHSDELVKVKNIITDNGLCAAPLYKLFMMAEIPAMSFS